MNTTTQTETNTVAATVAQTILAQINASDFWARARWGVKDCLADGNTLRLNCTKRIKILVTLEASDTYTIEIGRLKGRFDYVKHAEASDVYADQLVKIIDARFSEAFGSL